MSRALIYTRVSVDAAQGRSPEEQEREARQVCHREGWDVAEVVTDSVGASRYSKGKRSGWARAKQIIAAKTVDVLVTWEASRAQRDLTAYAELRDLCATNGVLWSYLGRTYDLTRKDDRFASGLDALFAEREADETSERVLRAMRANAAAGRPHGRRLYGYERTYDPHTGALTGQQPHPTEAATVRRIYSDYLAGLGIRTIAANLNRDGHTTSTNTPWRDSQVRRVLTNPAYAGRRTHNGETTDGTWAPLVDPDMFDRAGTLLESRRTRNTRIVGTARLLTGVARCGVCGGKMQVIHDRNRRNVYVCRAKFEVVRDLKRLDAYVTDTLLRRLRAHADPNQVGDDLEAVDARARITAERARIDAAVDQYAQGKLSATTLAKVEQRALAEIAAQEQRIRSALPLLDVAIPAGEAEAWAWWEDELVPEVRRELVAAYVAAVVVLPTGRTGRREFDPNAVRIEWR